MPIVVRAITNGIDGNDSCRLGVILPVKEQQLDAGGLAGENTEVDAIGANRGANVESFDRWL